MSSRPRQHSAGGVMYRAAAYDEDGNLTGALGPYATRAAAMRNRHMLTRIGVTARVETCEPAWDPVPGTEVER